MKLEDITHPYELLTDRIIVVRDIPYLTDANSPTKLDCEHSVSIISKISTPGEETNIKKILDLDYTIELTYQLNTKVIVPNEEKKIQLYSAYCEIIQILTYDPTYYPEVVNNSKLLGDFIAGSGLRAAWTRWRAQIGSFIAAAQLPAPAIDPAPPPALAERLA